MEEVAFETPSIKKVIAKAFSFKKKVVPGVLTSVTAFLFFEKNTRLFLNFSNLERKYTFIRLSFMRINKEHNSFL
ncbi:hypothetical protein [Vagococcus fluvialis]|uniref:hypothetical protein n=1 Tax=Vagococcus fluvialis TaxID=2738 RepID=UPI003B20E787